ncbi:hypothetical protein GF325_09455, partial [Candidatus Bathyarchaeota archaeon]|nr:hypothetical protein [Candidatus Bathyarchaeota archaeon]
FACAMEGCSIGPTGMEVEASVEMILAAEYPVLFTGRGAIQAAAFDEVRVLSKLLHAPVFTTIAGKGILPDLPSFENLHFGVAGLFGEKPNNSALRKADLVLAIGNRLTEDDTANFKYPRKRASMVQLDVDAANIGKHYHPLGVIGNPRASLQAIIKELRERLEGGAIDASMARTRDAANMKLAGKLKEYRVKDTKAWLDAEPMKPQRVLHAIRKALVPGDFVVTDASASSRWIGAYYPVKQAGRHLVTPRGVGPTGFGLGALLGTCIGAMTRGNHVAKAKKVLITGDGGLMNAGVSDLETIVKLDLDCTIVVLNNAALGFVRFGQAMLQRGRYIDTTRPEANFAGITEAFGGTGIIQESLETLDKTMEDSINTPGLTLVDTRVDPEEYLPPNSY